MTKAQGIATLAAAVLLGALVAITEIHRHAAAVVWPLLVFILEQN